ncbi:MAG TPA: NADH-quinone oxidoreductase subunit J [Pyrinomonadaceae bacterium]|jgi:NADH-quinone oxidoreductase subunit J
MQSILFIIFGGFAIGCAISMVVQRNPLYSAISLIGVFISLASLYVMLSAPFIAAVQVIVYAGAIMVLVIFVIMLLNIEEEEPRRRRLGYLLPLAVVLAAFLIAEAAFMLVSVQDSPNTPTTSASDVGLTSSIGVGLFTKYLLPFEITSILLLMAIVGAISLARRIPMSPTARAIPGSAVLPLSIVEGSSAGARVIDADSTAEVADLLHVHSKHSGDQK